MSEFDDFPEDAVMEAFSVVQKQKQVIEETEFFEMLKISDNEEAELNAFMTQWAKEPRSDGLFSEAPFEVTAEDLDMFEAQERALIKENIKTDQNAKNSTITPSKHFPSRNSAPLQQPHQLTPDILKIKQDLEHYKDQALSLQSELESHRRQILTKEGEISILRQRLTQLDNEKLLNAQKFAERTEQGRRELDLIEQKWRGEIENLKTELLFKEQELRSLASHANRARKVPKSAGVAGNALASELESAAFGEIQAAKLNAREAPRLPLPVRASNAPMQHDRRLIDDLATMAPEDLLAKVFQLIDHKWDFSRLKEFDALDIARAKGQALKEARRVEPDNYSHHALAGAIVKLLDHAVCLRQPALLTYVCQTLAASFDWAGRSFKEGVKELRTDDGLVKLYSLIVKVLTQRVIVGGIPTEIISLLALTVNVIIYQNDFKIPEELKALAEKGFWQWMLRNIDKFQAEQVISLMSLFHTMSCDLASISGVFLSAETDKIQGCSVLDLLQMKALDLLDCVFPHGLPYRRRPVNATKKQLELEPDELANLQKLDALCSLLFSFVQRSLGPITLWVPEKLLRRLAYWCISLIRHDLMTLKDNLFLPPPIMFAHDTLLVETIKCFTACWRAPDLCMGAVLKRLRLPLAYAVQQISIETSSYQLPATVAAATELFGLIRTDVEADLASLKATGQLAQRPAPSEAAIKIE